MPRFVAPLGLMVLTTACSQHPQQVHLDVQRLCGRPVSAEVAYQPIDLSKIHDVRLPVAQPVLLVFDPGCRGVKVTPAPSKTLELAQRPPGIEVEVSGPDGLVGGLYASSAQRVVRLLVTPPTAPAYDVTLRFRASSP